MTAPPRRAHGPTVRAVREALGLSSTLTADRARISYGYFTNIEKGRRRPGPGVTTQIAAVLEVEAEILTGQKPAIAAIRRALGISAATLARDVGIGLDHLERIEVGSELPAEAQLLAIATRLGVDHAALRPHVDLMTRSDTLAAS